MNPVTALMLSRAIEQDRRREIESRRHRLLTPEPMGRPSTGRRGWAVRLPRFGFAGSKA